MSGAERYTRFPIGDRILVPVCRDCVKNGDIVYIVNHDQEMFDIATVDGEYRKSELILTRDSDTIYSNRRWNTNEIYITDTQVSPFHDAHPVSSLPTYIMSVSALLPEELKVKFEDTEEVITNDRTIYHRRIHTYYLVELEGESMYSITYNEETHTYDVQGYGIRTYKPYEYVTVVEILDLGG
jgi:hypothetical protein